MTPRMPARGRGRFGELFDRLSAQRGEEHDDFQAEEAVRFLDQNPMRAQAKAASVVSWPLRVASAWSWRFLVVLAATAAAAWIAMKLSVVVLPVAIALLLTVLLEPLVALLVRRGHLSRTAAAAAGLLLALVAVIALVSQAAAQLFVQFPDLLTKAADGLEKALDWLKTGPLALDTSVIDKALTSMQEEITKFLQSNSSVLASGALSVTSSLISIVTGSLITLFCLFFFLKEGRRIWLWVIRLLPAPARAPMHESAIRGWVTLGSYVRTQIKVAAIDAAGIGLGAFFLGVPMALPITVLVFFGSFIPIVGAFISGSVAVLVALVDQGPAKGLIMLVIILAVQQLEGNVLQPWLMSSAVSLHPVAVLLVVTGAGSVAGIVGAVFGVPIAAFLNATFLYLHGYDGLPWLATKTDRPGGPPGMLDSMVAASYSGSQDGRHAGGATGASPEGPGLPSDVHAGATSSPTVRQDTPAGRPTPALGESGTPGTTTQQPGPGPATDEDTPL
ncbi:MAG: AI-2E family transporter [Propionibacterium sp.]|nr:AI-2E family transporter [Propionibacterium sp.]MDN6795086.1 AI-2E family transporter [Propionibacterium sp.]